MVEKPLKMPCVYYNALHNKVSLLVGMGVNAIMYIISPPQGVCTLIKHLINSVGLGNSQHLPRAH